jgi:hypothetical protein
LLFFILLFYQIINNLFLIIFILEAQSITLIYFISSLQASARRLSTKGNGLTGVNSDFKQKQL